MDQKQTNKKKDRIGRDEKVAGIYFPINRIKTGMKKLKVCKSITKAANVFLTAELEYICAELIEISGSLCLGEDKKTLTSRHIFKAINEDKELKRIYGNSIIHDGGVRETLGLEKPKTNVKK